MQLFAEKYINNAYKNTSCYCCNRNINSDNTTLKSIILGKKKYDRPICESCSKGGNVIIFKSIDLEDDDEKSIASESAPSTNFVVRQHSRVSEVKQNKVAVRPFKKRKFLES